MNRILILSETESDLAAVIKNSCPGAEWLPLHALGDAPLENYSALCILCGDREKPYILPALLRNRIEEFRASKKKVFCEFVASVGQVYSGEPTETSHHRMIYSDKHVLIDGLSVGDILDGHRNHVIPYYFVPSDAEVILTYYDYICGHDHFDGDADRLKNGRMALWKLDESTLISSIRLANFKRARLSPRDSWEKIITYVVSFLAGEAVTPVFPSDVCRHGHGTAVRTSVDTDTAVQRGLSWFKNAKILKNGGADGVLEGFSHHVSARDGHQEVADSVRADCTGEVGGAFMLDYLTNKNEESLEIFKNTAAFCFDRLQVKSGAHKGMLRWSEMAYETCYQDDVARAVIPTLLFENFGEGSEYFACAVDALEYLAETTGEDGLRVARTDCCELSESRMLELKKAGVGTPSAHYNAWYHAALLLASRAGAPSRLADLACRGLEAIMSMYPETRRETSETEEMCRLVLPLALLYEHTGERKHYEWLLRVTGDLERVSHPSGGYAEWDTGYRAACARNDKGECALLANNGDPVADLLYSNNWLPLGFAYAYMVTGETLFYEKWASICTFLTHCQIHSSDKRLDGAWTRAMDMNRMEAYGVPHDVGWAPCCMESGWTVAEILMGMQFMRVAEAKI